MGKKLDFSVNGVSGSGYLSLPSTGSGPAVIVIQEWWGLVGHITDVVDRFATAGRVAEHLNKAPPAGLDPATSRLTVECSTN